MVRPIEAVAADFDALDEADFDWSNPTAEGPERLWPLCDELALFADVHACASVLLGLMERLPESDLGSPGPLVHTLESLGNYEEQLAASVQRRPVPLSLWMVNRILNARPIDAQRWLRLLRSVATHPQATEQTKAEALGFLDHQASAELADG